MTPWIVLKFGGTSVATAERWHTIAATAQARLGAGERPFIVCSAVSQVSRQLRAALEETQHGGDGQALVAEIQERHRTLGAELGVDAEALLGERFGELERLVLGASLTRDVSPALFARVLALGELLSTALGAAFLQGQGLPTTWLDARSLLTAQEHPRLLPSRRYLAATVSAEPDAALQARLAAVETPVLLTQGFIASTPGGETVLIGWGGSDTSAAYFAGKLQARRLEIWTDVPGMFTTNPRVIPSARLLRRLSYDEAQELASTGAEVLHPRSIDPVRRQGIPLHIRCTPAPEMEHTVIGDTAQADAQVKALSARKGVTLIAMESPGMWHEVGFLARVFTVFDRHDLSVDLVATSETNVTVSLDPGETELEAGVLEAVLAQLRAFCEARVIGPCAAVSLVGRRIRSLLPKLGPVLEALEEQTIHLVTQSASDLNFTFVVDEDHADRLVRRLHAELFSGRPQDDLFGPSWQMLLGEAEGRAATPPAWWRARRADLLAVAAAHAPCYVYDRATLRAAAERLRGIEAVDRVFYAMKANDHPEVLRLFADLGLGIECVSPGELARVREVVPELPPDRLLFTPNFAPRADYEAALALGVHVTLDNLHPLAHWGALFAGRDVLVRVDPGRGHGHHRHVRTAGAQSKFGVAPDDLERLRLLAHKAGARIVGLHVHVGSGVQDAETWAETALFLASLAERFPDVRVLNVGGGLGVPDRPGAPALDVDALAAGLTPVRAAYPQYALWMEPGRYLVAQAGVLLARVTQRKHKGAVHYVGVETGMNSLIRPALYGAYHDIVNLTRLEAPMAITAKVVGPICETGDVLGHDRRLPETEEGDVLLIDTAGAYGHVMASSYNQRPPAQEVVLGDA